MSNYLTPNMSLVIPVPTLELGPNWAYDINASLTILDGHNHTSGAGVQIPTSAIMINNDLSFNNAYSLIDVISVRLFNNLAVLAGPQDLGCIYEAGGDFYYNNSAGISVRITDGANVAVGPSPITGLPYLSASFSYQGALATFKFEQLVSVAANIDCATVAIRYPGSYPTLTGNYIAIQAPASLASAYALTLPALPPQNNVMTLDTTGVISSVSFDAVGQSMTLLGADAIGMSMSSVGANAVASSRTRVVGSSVGAGGVAISGSSLLFQTPSTSFVDVPNLSVTLATTGRPVVVTLMGDGVAPFLSYVGVSSSTTTASCLFNIVRILSGVPTVIYTSLLSITALSNLASGTAYTVPPGAVNQTDVVLPGTYTYIVQVSISTGIASVAYCKLMAYEI